MRERTSTLLRPARAATAPAAANAVRPPGAAPRLGNGALHAALRAHVVQAKLHVGGSDDAYEREADRVADRITGGTGVATTPHPSGPPSVVSRIAALPGAAGGPMPRAVEDAIGTLSAGGSPLPGHMQAEFGPRLGADLSDVRVHTGDHAAGMAASIGARAFTVDRHIVFGAGEYQPSTAAGRHVIAHELTHSVQQRGGSATLSAAPRAAQRLSLFSSIASALSELAIKIPGYELMTLLIGYDPITGDPVVRTAEKVVHAVLMLFPFAGEGVYQNMKETGQLKRLADYINQQVDKLHLTWSGVMRMFSQAVASLGATDFFQPTKAWAKIKAAFGPTLGLIVTVVSVISNTVADWIKKKAFDFVRGLAVKIPGYKMLSFVLGRDPLTDEPVERTVVTFVRAAFDLLPGGDEMYKEAQKSGALQRIHTWLNKEIDKLDLTWAGVKAIIRAIVDAFEITDFFDPVALFKRLDPKTMLPLLRLIRFIGNCADKVWEIIVDAIMRTVGPLASKIMGILRKVGSTFMKIISHPIDFCGHLVDAMKGGFNQFKANIEQHLKDALVKWLTGALGTTAAPKTWEPGDILVFVLETIGISYANFREKIVNRVGESRAAALEQAVEFVTLVKEQGLGAGWDLIVQKLGDVKSMVLDGIREWAITDVTVAAVQLIVKFFVPGLGLFKAVRAIYDTIAFLIERWDQIVAMCKSVVDSLADIVEGKVSAAINAVERTMVKTLPVIMSFLARFLRIDNIVPAVQEIVKKLATSVDKALVKVVDWVVDTAKTVVGAVTGRDEKKPSGEESATPAAGAADVTTSFKMEGVQHELRAHVQGDGVRFFMKSQEEPLEDKLNRIARDFKAQHPGTDSARTAAFEDRLTKLRTLIRKEYEGFRTFLTSKHEGKQRLRDDDPLLIKLERDEISAIASELKRIAADFHITGEFAEIRVHRFKSARTDEYWRAQSVEADLSSLSLRQRDEPLFRPSGFKLKKGAYDAGHLLASSLGGPGLDWGNVATMTSYANKSRFSSMEIRIRNALAEFPTMALHYIAKANYENGEAETNTWLHREYNADLAKRPAHVLYLAVGRQSFEPFTLKSKDIIRELPETKRTVSEYDAELICEKLSEYYWARSFTVNISVISGPPGAPVIESREIPNTERPNSLKAKAVRKK